MALLKTIFHVHTDYSDDSDISIERLITMAKSCGVQCMAVTDHDTIAGAQQLAGRAGDGLKILIGEEISTLDGHLIGLFLQEPVESGLPARQTAELIRGQGGLVVVPHPFNRIFGCSLREKVDDLLDLIDIVEVCNAQNLLSYPNRQAEDFARRHRLGRIVGADSHHGRCLDACYQWLKPFDGPTSFLSALKDATYVQGRHSISYFARTAWFVLLAKSGCPVPVRFGRNCTTYRPMFEA